MNISYQLDGKDIAPAELAGKSGKVTIRFDYENHCTTTATVDGKEETLYVPFAALTGMLLDNEHFTNIEVTNGRVVNDGSHTVVVGIAFPGLQDDLNIERDTLELPDYVEVSADVTNFALDTTLTLATNSVFSALQDSDFETVDDLKASFAKLTDAMQQLLDGSSELYEGLETLLEKSQTLVDGVGTLNNGAAAPEDRRGQPERRRCGAGKWHADPERRPFHPVRPERSPECGARSRCSSLCWPLPRRRSMQRASASRS